MQQWPQEDGQAYQRRATLPPGAAAPQRALPVAQRVNGYYQPQSPQANNLAKRFDATASLYDEIQRELDGRLSPESAAAPSPSPQQRTYHQPYTSPPRSDSYSRTAPRTPSAASDRTRTSSFGSQRRTSAARPLPRPPPEVPPLPSDRPMVPLMRSSSSGSYYRSTPSPATRQSSPWSPGLASVNSYEAPLDQFSVTPSDYYEDEFYARAAPQAGPSRPPPAPMQPHSQQSSIGRASPFTPMDSQSTLWRQSSFGSGQLLDDNAEIENQFTVFTPESEYPAETKSLGGSQLGIQRSDTLPMYGLGSSKASVADVAIPEHMNRALLSNMAVFVKDRVPRRTHTRGAIPYANAFTGRDVVNLIQRALPESQSSDRATALLIARSLQAQLLFFEVRGSDDPIQDTLDQVYTFFEDEKPAEPDQWVGSSSKAYTAARYDTNEYSELPTGVITDITPCYSPFCSRLNAAASGCYSFSCPNSPQNTALRHKASASEATTQKDSELQWVETVPKDTLQYLSKHEVTRQSTIWELITGQAEYLRDIDVLRSDFLVALTEADPPIIPIDQQPGFFQEVLMNAFEVREHAASFHEALLARQREQGPVIQAIGDVCLNAARDWGPAYERYLTDVKLAEQRVREERQVNPAFDAFIKNFQSRPNARRKDFHHFLTLITFRQLRYSLLLDRIASHMDDDDHNDDKQAVLAASNLIKEQSRQANAKAAATEIKVECRRYHQDLVPHPNTNCLVDLDLTNEERQIFHRGKMLRKPDGTASGFTDWSELFVVLFDHYLVMTKPRGRDKNSMRYHISRRIVPLELLSAGGFDDPPQTRPTGFHLRNIGGSGSTTTVSSPQTERAAYPITFRYLGRRGGVFTLFVDTPQAREQWKNKLIEAITKREDYVERTKAMELTTISDQTFRARPTIDQPSGRPTCSVSFATPEGHQLVAIGHAEGLWIGLQHDSSSFRLVLHLRSITQVSVLQDFALVLVLADKALYAYPLEALVPSAASASSLDRGKDPQKLSGSKDVLFFKAGKVGKRLLVIYVKRNGVNQTVFKALEPISVQDRGPRGLLGRKKPEWFRIYNEFFCPSEVFSIIFLRSQLSIICAKGFELMSLESEPLKMVSFPEWAVVSKSDPKALDLMKRCNDSRALAMFRLSDGEFLFCYSDLAFYCDKHGDPLPSRFDDTIDWQGTPRSVALYRPFLLAFDEHFIEVRHAHTGRLLQIIKGREVACTFDGQSVSMETGQGTGESDRRVHVALNLGQNNYTIAELVPTAMANAISR